jgi:SAM-dependent methyltransferase
MLDVGCGDGTFLLGARQAGWQAAGTEYNAALARDAGLEVWQSLDEASARAPYGCITFWHSLEHFRDPRAALEQSARLLGDQGTLLIAVPNTESLQALAFGPGWFHLDVPRHLYHFNYRSLGRMLDAAGLEITGRFAQEMEMDVFGWSQSALNRISSEQNVFFRQVTGRASSADVLHLAGGVLLSAVSIPLSVASAIASRSAALVVAARRR